MYVRHAFEMQLTFGKDRFLFMVKIAQGSETSATLRSRPEDLEKYFYARAVARKLVNQRDS